MYQKQPARTDLDTIKDIKGKQGALFSKMLENTSRIVALEKIVRIEQKHKYQWLYY